MSNQVTRFDYKPYDKFDCNPINHYISNEAIPIVIYNNDIILSPELKNEIKEIAITEKEKNWIINSDPVRMQIRVSNFYHEVLNSGFVTFGHQAYKLGEKISEHEFIGNVSYQTDKYGMFNQILKMRDKNNKLKETCYNKYNYPQPSLIASDIQKL